MEVSDFNHGWTFAREGADPVPVTLPHDAMIHERRSPDAPGGSAHGYFPGGRYVYRKEIDADAALAKKVVQLRFGGVYRDAEILLDGEHLLTHHYGYTPFICDLTGLLDPGAHELEVRVDNADLPNSRWYTGSGIYRGVKLLVAGSDHIPYGGIHVTTTSIDPARVRVSTAVAGSGVPHVEIVAPDGSLVARGEGADVELEVPDARLWSAEEPNLYRARVTLLAEDSQEDAGGPAVLDRAEATFGIRNIAWNSREGLLVNGKPTLLRGGCIHHDNGILGALAFAESEERRVRIMREAGFNAIRSAHNPASDELLEACERLGMYVMDETFDMWFHHKSPYDYAKDFEQDWRQDVSAMVERDFDHPSVIMYSIGNEVSEPAHKHGLATERDLVGLVHGLDPSRPVSAGLNLSIIANAAKGKEMYDGENQPGAGGKDSKRGKGGQASSNASLLFNTLASLVGTGMNKAANSDKADKATSPALELLDICGYNYASGRYPLEGRKHPDRVIFGSETFPQDIAKNWAMVRRYPYLVGDFMWTAWDYLGEAGLGAWSYTGGVPFNRPYPWLLSGAGVIDILGNPDASARFAQVAWGLEKGPFIGVRPANHPGTRVSKSVWRGTNALESWSWRGREGNQMLVEVFCDADEVELLLDGRPLGRKRVKDLTATFKVHYEPDKLEAIAYQAGCPVGKASLESATGRIGLKLSPEKDAAAPGALVYVPVALVGGNGVVESNADEELSCTVEGCELLGFGSANPCTEERYDSGQFTSCYGRALAIIRMGAGTAHITVSGRHAGTTSAEIRLT